MLNSSAILCSILYLVRFNAIALLCACGSYLGHTFQHTPRFYNFWVIFISPKNLFFFGQFTYSTSILQCLACTILQECVSPFEFILVSSIGK